MIWRVNHWPRVTQGGSGGTKLEALRLNFRLSCVYSGRWVYLFHHNQRNEPALDGHLALRTILVLISMETWKWDEPHPYPPGVLKATLLKQY